MLTFLSGCVSSLFYYPDRVTYQTPDAFHLTYEDVFFNSRDGTKLHAWFLPAVGEPHGTVIHFHGNAQNISAHFEFVSWLPAQGFNVFVFDYRGYGRSAGKPNRRGVYEDSRAAIEYILSRTDIDQHKLVIFGQSLGGANAIAVLGAHTFTGIQAVAIEATFFSYRSIVRDKIGVIPLISFFKGPLSNVMINNNFSAGPVVQTISPIPLLLIHGTSDHVIPAHHSQRLFEKAGEPKELWLIKGGDHIEAFTRFGAEYKDRLVTFFKNAVMANRTVP